MAYYQFNPSLVSAENIPLLEQLLDCNNFVGSDRLLGCSKGRGVTWFLDMQAELGVNCVRRHYYRGGLFGKIVKDRYFFQSLGKTRAAQEFELLTKMHHWGLPVPRPIGFKIERHWGFYQADILIEKIEQTQDLSQLLQQKTLESEQYQQLGKLIRQLHDHQVHHSDLNIHNILLDQQGKFWLIDFDKCHIQQGNEWKQGNLDRLLRSFHKERGKLNILFSPQHWGEIIKGYANA